MKRSDSSEHEKFCKKVVKVFRTASLKKRKENPSKGQGENNSQGSHVPLVHTRSAANKYGHFQHK